MITVGFFLVLILMSIVAFFQNMAFTAVSRSRNSGDPNYHRYCAWGSNGIWFACQMFIWSQIMPILMTPITAWTFLGTVKLLITMAVYTLSTTEGSVYMMKILLKKERGKRQVGGNAIADMQKQMKYITNRLDDLEGLNYTHEGSSQINVKLPNHLFTTEELDEIHARQVEEQNKKFRSKDKVTHLRTFVKTPNEKGVE